MFLLLLFQFLRPAFTKHTFSFSILIDYRWYAIQNGCKVFFLLSILYAAHMLLCSFISIFVVIIIGCRWIVCWCRDYSLNVQKSNRCVWCDVYDSISRFTIFNLHVFFTICHIGKICEFFSFYRRKKKQSREWDRAHVTPTLFDCCVFLCSVGQSHLFSLLFTHIFIFDLTRIIYFPLFALCTMWVTHQ